MPWARIGEFVGQRNLAVTANTYSHVLIDETEVDYAGLWCDVDLGRDTGAGAAPSRRSLTLTMVPSRLLPGECPFDSRDDVQERENAANLEGPFDKRRSPQHHAELAAEFPGVLPRLDEYTDCRGVDELGG